MKYQIATVALLITLGMGCRDAKKEQALAAQIKAEKERANDTQWKLDSAKNKLEASEKTCATLTEENSKLTEENAKLKQKNGEMATQLESQNSAAVAEQIELARSNPESAAASVLDVLKEQASTSGASNLQQKLLPKLLKSDGSPASESDLTAGGATMLYYSASWCGPCRQISPLLEQNASFFKEQGLTLVLVGRDKNTDAAKKYLSHIPSFLGVMPEDYKTLGLSKYASRGIPHCVILDAKDNVLFKGHPGYLLNAMRK